MKEYEDLTPEAKRKRMSNVVAESLKTYDINVANIDYLDTCTNMFFKVSSMEGEHYAAKVVMDNCIAEEDNLLEAYLLELVSERSDIRIPKVVKNNCGDSVVTVDAIYTSEKKRVMIYEWFNGIDVDGTEDETYFKGIGKVTAKLHNALEHARIPKLQQKKWDKVFYFKDERAVYKDECYASVLTDDYHDVMTKAIAHLDDELPKLYDKNKAFLIHGDLNPWNIKRDGDELVLFDFEDNIYGTALHDLAIMLYYYEYSDRFDFNKVKSWYFEGYSSVRPLPDFTDRELDQLLTARRVNFLNYILQVDDSPSEYIERNIPRVKSYFEKYGI